MSQSYRLQVATWYDSLAPREAFIIDPCFHVTGAGAGDPQQLSDDLALAIKTYLPAAPMIRVRAYELPYVRGAGHVAEAVQNNGLSPASSLPREIAICLSYFAGQNKPRYRGRLYVPIQWLGLAISGNRPSTAQMTKVMDLRTVLEGLGGINVDFIVWSLRDNTNRSVSDFWVDDEFDVVRSRGLKGTTRQQASSSEDDIPNFVRLAPQGTMDLAS